MNFKALQTLKNFKTEDGAFVVIVNKECLVVTPWCKYVSKLYLPSYRRFLAKIVPSFADTGIRVATVTGPYGRIMGFLYRSSYYLFHVSTLDTVPDSLYLRKFVSAGARTWNLRTCSQEL
jgi:hypothetical protein